MAINPQYSWLAQEVVNVAPMLLGCELQTCLSGVITAGRIVEVEAYGGTEDPASHAFRGPTHRTMPMFAAAGTIYVYLSYGVHLCVNITTGPEGRGQAVLIRSLEPTQGLDVMAARRRTTNPVELCNGPGKLTQALGITLDLSGTPIGKNLQLTRPAKKIPPSSIIAKPRIGISRAPDVPLRFLLAKNQFVSRP